MSFSRNLHLYEEVMLLALKEEEGTIFMGTMYSYALGGALIAELLLDKRIAVEDTEKKRVTLLDAKQYFDPVLDETLAKIGQSKKQQSLQDWVSRIASLKDLRHKAAGQLCRRGVLREDEDKILLIFNRKIYPEVDPAPERKIMERLREAVFGDSGGIDPRTAVLISLAKTSGILERIFDKKELKPRKERIETIVNGEVIGKAAKDAIEAVQAVILVTAMAPVIVTTTS